jgi:hypothetical protein
VFEFQNFLGFHLRFLLIWEYSSWGKVLAAPFSLAAVERLLASDFLNKSRHPHTLRDQTCSGMMHGRQQLAAGTVNACDLPYVNFDFFAAARLRVPNTLGFTNPGAAKFAGEFQSTLAAILVKHDS